jgi:hypothetical protein
MEFFGDFESTNTLELLLLLHQKSVGKCVDHTSLLKKHSAESGRALHAHILLTKTKPS